MSQFARTAFVQGWMPDADPSQGPVEGLLRMDNCILDALGIVSLRPGSTPLNTVPLGGLATDVHSLFTGQLNGTRYRFAGVSDAIYVNGGPLIGGVSGSGDISFGSHLGQILMARGSTKKKFDGGVTNWGIAPPNGVPTVAPITADLKVFATGDSTESPAFVADEGSIAGFVTGADGTANGAIEVTPATGTGRGSITKTFVAETDFSILNGLADATDDDVISLYVYLANPANLQQLTLAIDINANPTNRFQEDYYSYVWKRDTKAPIAPPARGGSPGNRQMPDGPESPAELARIERAIQNAAAVAAQTPIVQFSPIAGWNKLSITRGQFSRSGATSGKGWSTVKAVRVIAENTGGGAANLFRVDDIRISGGPMTGVFRWVAVLVRNTGTYQAVSGASAVSDDTTVSAQAADVTIPADGSRDPQANELWLYRMGGALDAFYRVATTPISGTGAITIRDSLSDVDALVINLLLDTDTTVPPDNIIGLVAPYYDRTFCLTSDGLLYASRRLNPDGYATKQVIRVAGADETPYWVIKANGGLYIGTSKDVYRLSGTGAELPDDTVDFTKEELNIDHPPINSAVAQDGNLLIYCASDGWRIFSGSGSKSIIGPTSLLYKGYTRHGVSPVNLSGRLRAVLAKGQLVVLTPEGASADSSPVLYRYVLSLDRWYRHTYTRHWRALAREPDGTLIAGETNGLVWTLDTGTVDDTASIDVNLRTMADANGLPFHQKQASNVVIHAQTGTTTMQTAVHLDESETAAVSGTLLSSTLAVTPTSLVETDPARRFQLRVEGFTTAFRFGGWTLTYQLQPLGIRAWDSGPMDLGVNELVWMRDLRVKVQASADLTATITIDGRRQPVVTIPVTHGPKVFEVSLGKGYKGRTPRVVITSTAAFQPYWVEVIARSTTTQLKKPTIRIPVALGGETAA